MTKEFIKERKLQSQNEWKEERKKGEEEGNLMNVNNANIYLSSTRRDQPG
jgi:hypothetical protein